MSRNNFALLIGRVILLVAVTILPSQAVSQSTAGSMATADLPVRELVITTSGVATFVHEGTVSGTVDWWLRVPSDAMDDLLQSLVLEDFDGGVVQAVRYDARDALDRRLASFAFDLRTAESLADLLAQARGERVTFTGDERVTGTIVTVDRMVGAETDATQFVTLSTDIGLQRVALASVASVTFDDAALQRDLEAALSAIADDRARDEAIVRIRFEGEGARRVSVRYLREMPVWKPTYRMVVHGDGSASLQGWAILDNPTDLDLEGVQVTLLAGAPVAFRTALFEPRYVERDVVNPAVTGTAGPAADEGALAEAAFAPPVGMAVRSAAPTLLGSGIDAAASGAATASAFAYTVDAPVHVARQSSTMVPILTERVAADRVTVVDETNAAWRAVWFRNTSDLLLPAGTVTLYGDAGFEGNALLADLPPGSARWLGFAGDLGVRVARERTQPAQTVERAYLDGGLIVQETLERMTTTVRIARDDGEGRTVLVEVPLLEGWTVRAPAGPAPIRTETTWRFGVQLEGTGGTTPAAPSDLPVQVTCTVGEACTFDVTLERQTDRSILVQSMARDALAVLLRNDVWSGEDRAVLEEIVALQDERAAAERRLADATRERDALGEEQARIRENMAVLERDGDLYRRYVTDLANQEDVLQDLLTTVDTLRTDVQDVQDRIDAALRRLTAR